MAAMIRPRTWPSLPPAPKPESRADPRVYPIRRQEPAPRPQVAETRERRAPFYHTLDWARGMDRDRGWDYTYGRDYTKGIDRSKGRDRTGMYRN